MQLRDDLLSMLVGHLLFLHRRRRPLPNNLLSTLPCTVGLAKTMLVPPGLHRNVTVTPSPALPPVESTGPSPERHTC